MLEYVEVARAGPWLTGGSFTAADVQMSFPLEAATARGAAAPASIAAFLASIRDRPAYRLAVDRAGGFDALA